MILILSFHVSVEGLLFPSLLYNDRKSIDCVFLLCVMAIDTTTTTTGRSKIIHELRCFRSRHEIRYTTFNSGNKGIAATARPTLIADEV